MARRVLLVALLLACQDDGDGAGTASGGTGSGGTASGGTSGGSPGGGGSSGAGSGGGGSGGEGSCYYGTAPAPTSTVTGSGFDAWNGETAHGCWLPAQSFAPACAYATVVDGGFSLTASTCTGFEWRINIGERTCFDSGNLVTPADCHCGDLGSRGGTSGFACDAGAP
jgi:hypothetical protein